MATSPPTSWASRFKDSLSSSSSSNSSAPPLSSALIERRQQEQEKKKQDAKDLRERYRSVAIRTTFEILDIVAEAKKKIRTKDGGAPKVDDHVICCMFYLDENKKLAYVMEVSGKPTPQEQKSIKELREKASAEIDKYKRNPEEKATFCAEERLLINNSGKDFLFSWAFDESLDNTRPDYKEGDGPRGRGQMICACGDACRGILEYKGINDLVREEHWNSGAHRNDKRDPSLYESGSSSVTDTAKP